MSSFKYQFAKNYKSAMQIGQFGKIGQLGKSHFLTNQSSQCLLPIVFINELKEASGADKLNKCFNSIFQILEFMTGKYECKW